jgi:conserved oligomeric Golgi complex subunit 5
VEEHTEAEAWSLIESGLAHWEKVAEAEGKNIKESTEYIQLAHAVLEHAKNTKSESS